MFRARFFAIALSVTFSGCGAVSSSTDPSLEQSDEPAGNPSSVPSTPQATIPPHRGSEWEALPPGVIVDVLDAAETSHVSGAKSAYFVRYTTTNVAGARALASGLVLIPETQPYSSGQWPMVLYSHMTTGAADACAPTHGTNESSELRRMQQGDSLARLLLARGVVVARPDYEGMGEEGPHPYLRGEPLARSVRDMAVAVKAHWPEIGNRWISAGHSEGGVSALNTGNRLLPELANLNLIGIAAITPVTQLEYLLTIAEPLPVDAAGALAGLALKGIATVDPDFKSLLFKRGGLSPRAIALWPDLERLCLEDLGNSQTWGGMTVNDMKGPNGDQVVAEVRNALQKDDIRHLQMRSEVPIRIDAGISDAVALLPFTEQLVNEYRQRGYDVTYQRWPATHSPTADMAAPAISKWIMERFDQ